MIKNSFVKFSTLLNSHNKNFCKKKLQNLVLRRCSTAAAAGGSSRVQWDLVGSICVERRPIITRDLNEIELQFKKYMEEFHLERSHFSDHELRHMEDLKRAEAAKSSKDVDIHSSPVQTAQDYEDACEAELKNFTPASRITEEDLKNDQRSLNRALDRPLVLVVRQRLGTEQHWLLPQAVHCSSQETGLRGTAERALTQLCGSHLRIHTLGNAPFGFYKYKYPKSMRADTNAIGAKVFFFKALYVEGQVEDSADYRWLTRVELEDYLHPDYLKAVRQIIVPQYPLELQDYSSM